MKMKDLLIPAAMLALGAGIGFAARDRPPSAQDIVPTPTTPAHTSAPNVDALATPTPAQPPRTDAATPDPVAAVAPTTASTLLPAMDAPVVEVIAALRDRAVAGDRVAACRLAADLMLCDWWQLDYSETELDEINPDKARSKQDLALMESHLKMVAAGQVRKRRCAGVQDSHLRESGHWLRTAARAGHVASMYAYAESGGIPHTKFLARLPDLAIYRDEAATMIESAARAGSVAAVRSLSMVLDDNGAGPMLAEVYATRRDPLEALTYRMLFAIAVESKDRTDQATAELMAGYRSHALKFGKLTPEQIDTAERRAQQRFLDWFHGRRAPMLSIDMLPFALDREDGRRPINDVCRDGPWTTPPRVNPALRSDSSG